MYVRHAVYHAIIITIDIIMLIMLIMQNVGERGLNATRVDMPPESWSDPPDLLLL